MSAHLRARSLAASAPPPYFATRDFSIGTNVDPREITASGAITEYGGLSPGAGPTGITVGPAIARSRALWFTEYNGNRIGKITTAGVVSEYAIPAAASGPANIVTGPDNNLWFTERAANKIGRYKPTTNTFTEYPVPTAGAAPDAITVGPDHALWFTERSGNNIGRISTAGVFNEYPIPTAGATPETIVSGADGALWFTESMGNALGRITVTGQITEFPVPTAGDPDGLTLGPDANLWFTEYAAHRIGRLLPAAASVAVLHAGPAPTTITVPLGTTVEWSFRSGGTDSVSDSSGLGLFASGNHVPVSFYAFPFATAGTYTYNTGTIGSGQISVAPIAIPTTGTTNTNFYIEWAQHPPPSGDVYDVRIRRPGSKLYSSWQTGTTATTSYFTPAARRGTYWFEARTRNASNSQASLYASTFVTVTNR